MDAWDEKLEGATIQENKRKKGFEVHIPGQESSVGWIDYAMKQQPFEHIELYNLNVLPHVQKRNIAQMLLHSCERLAIKLGVPATIAEGSDHPSPGMYGKRYGWDKLDESEISERAMKNPLYHPTYIFNMTRDQYWTFVAYHKESSMNRFDPQKKRF